MLSHAHTLRINSERYLLHLLYTCFFFFWGGFTFCFWFVHLGFLIPGGRGSDFLSTDVKLANAIIYLFIYFYTELNSVINLYKLILNLQKPFHGDDANRLCTPHKSIFSALKVNRKRKEIFKLWIIRHAIFFINS